MGKNTMPHIIIFKQLFQSDFDKLIEKAEHINDKKDND